MLCSYVSDVQVAQTTGYNPHFTFPRSNLQTLTQQHATRPPMPAFYPRPAFYPSNSPSLALHPPNSSIHPLFQLQGRYPQIPAFNHNSFALGFHRSSPDLNIQQPNYTSILMNQPHLAHQPLTSNQSMFRSGMASYQQNSLFSHGPSPSQTYPVPYSGGLSSSVISGFQRLNQ